MPIAEGAALANEWAVIVDAPGYAACLLAWEQPGATPGPDDGDRRFEAIWTIDPRATRRAAQAAARLAGTVDADYGRRLEELLADRPLALEQPAPALTALTNRLLAYVEAATGNGADQLDDDLIARQGGALARGHDREAVGAEHRAELVGPLRPGRHGEPSWSHTRTHSSRSGWRGTASARWATIRSGYGARPAWPRARAARRA